MILETLQKISTQILAKQVPKYKRYLFSKIDFNSKLIGIKDQRGYVITYDIEIGFRDKAPLWLMGLLY